MAVVTPADWTAAALDSAVPSDPAPLLAIAFAIQERTAVAPGGYRIIPPGLRFTPGDALRYPCIEACRAILRSIRYLQGRFLDLSPRYGTYWAKFPDLLAATLGTPTPDRGVRSADALVADPPPPMPEPGEGDWTVAGYRAFLAWARRSLSAMRYVAPATAWSLGAWHGAADPPTSYTAGTGGGPGFSASWSSNFGTWEISSSTIAGGLAISNPAPLAAAAGAVMAGLYPKGTTLDPNTNNWTGNATWFAGAFGPISISATVPAYSAATVLSASDTLAASGAVLPPGTGDMAYFGAKLVPYLDYRDSYRFP